MLRIEVWSDIVCPFCYIGKRHLEAALSKFEHRSQVRVTWKSFELDPRASSTPGQSLDENLAKKYGRSVEWAKEMHEQMTERARTAGLDYRFDKAIPANSFDAHRLIHLAASHGIQDRAKERLCQAYYTLGENIADHPTLERIGQELGLPSDEVATVLRSDRFSDEVREDEDEAQALGVTGVPFFLLNRKYAISGAQPVELFERALKTAWEDKAAWLPLEPGNSDAAQCGTEGCEPE